MASSYIPDSIQNLIDRLDNVNSITDIESIIDMCHDAADYIYEMEGLKHKIKDSIDFSDVHVKCFLENRMYEVGGKSDG